MRKIPPISSDATLFASTQAGVENLDMLIKLMLASGKNIFLLSGTLGSGKTTLVQAFLAHIRNQEKSAQNLKIQNLEARNQDAQTKSKNAESSSAESTESNQAESERTESKLAESSSAESTPEPHALSAQTQPQSTPDTPLPAFATSPTFSIMHDYGGVYHYDLYNHSAADLLEMGLLEWLSAPGFHFVEWGEALWDILRHSGFERALIRITIPNTQNLDSDKSTESNPPNASTRESNSPNTNMLSANALNTSAPNINAQNLDSRTYEIFI